MSGARSVMGRRALKAAVLVLVIIVSVPCVGSLMGLAAGFQQGDGRIAHERGLDASELLKGADAFASLERLESVAQAVNPHVPDVFVQEIGFLQGARDVRADTTTGVVGYLVNGQVYSVFDSLVSHMEGKGWSAVPIGASPGATFVKESGDITWALATCSQEGGAVSVVVRCMLS